MRKEEFWAAVLQSPIFKSFEESQPPQQWLPFRYSLDYADACERLDVSAALSEHPDDDTMTKVALFVVQYLETQVKQRDNNRRRMYGLLLERLTQIYSENSDNDDNDEYKVLLTEIVIQNDLDTLQKTISILKTYPSTLKRLLTFALGCCVLYRRIEMAQFIWSQHPRTFSHDAQTWDFDNPHQKETMMQLAVRQNDWVMLEFLMRAALAQNQKVGEPVVSYASECCNSGLIEKLMASGLVDDDVEEEEEDNVFDVDDVANNHKQHLAEKNCRDAFAMLFRPGSKESIARIRRQMKHKPRSSMLIPRCDVTVESMQTLLDPNEMLDDAVINAYLTLAETTAHRHAADRFGKNKIWNIHQLAVDRAAYPEMEREWDACETIILPIHLTSMMHWVLAVFFPKRKICVLFDSLYDNHKRKEAILALLQNQPNLVYLMHKQWTGNRWQDDWVFPDVQLVAGEYPKQTNGVDCGVFVCAFAVAALFDTRIPNEIPTRQVRERMAVDIFENKFHGSRTRVTPNLYEAILDIQDAGGEEEEEAAKFEKIVNLIETSTLAELLKYFAVICELLLTNPYDNAGWCYDASQIFFVLMSTVARLACHWCGGVRKDVFEALDVDFPSSSSSSVFQACTSWMVELYHPDVDVDDTSGVFIAWFPVFWEVMNEGVMRYLHGRLQQPTNPQTLVAVREWMENKKYEIQFEHPEYTAKFF